MTDRHPAGQTDGRTDARRHRQRLCIASRKRCHIENGYWKPLIIIIIIIIITIITFAWRHAVVTLEALAAGQREKSLKCYIKQKLFEARREDCQREWERERLLTTVLGRVPDVRCRLTKTTTSKIRRWCRSKRSEAQRSGENQATCQRLSVVMSWVWRVARSYHCSDVLLKSQMTIK